MSELKKENSFYCAKTLLIEKDHTNCSVAYQWKSRDIAQVTFDLAIWL